MDNNEDNLKVLSLLALYKDLSDHDESQFISHLIGEHDLLKKMGKWFEKNPFTTLFKTEFDIGAREKALSVLSDINEHTLLNEFLEKHKKLIKNKIVSQYFWIRVGRYDSEDDQDIIFQKIMLSKGYSISKTTCELSYDNEYVMHYNNVEMKSQYPLAYRYIKYDEAILLSQNRIKGIITSLSFFTFFKKINRSSWRRDYSS